MKPARSREVVFVLNNEFYSSQFVDERPYREARALAERGFDVTVLCTSLQHGHSELSPGNLSIDRLPASPKSGLTHIAILPFMAFVRKAFSDAIFHVHNPPDTLIFAGSGRTKILDLHDPWYLNAQVRGVSSFRLEIIRAAEKLAWSQADFIICPSVSVRDLVVENGFPQQETKVVMTCPDLDGLLDKKNSRAKLGLGKGPIILFEGVFHKNRGLRVLLQAMKLLRKEAPDSELLLVGDGPERTSLEEYARFLGLEKVVRFAGWRHLDELPTFVAAADVCVIPSLSTPPTEMAPHNKLFDFMAGQKPIVASNLGEIRRIVKHEVSALLVRPDDATALAESIIRLLRNSRLANDLARAARRLAEREYNWQVQKQGLLEVYERLSN